MHGRIWRAGDVGVWTPTPLHAKSQVTILFFIKSEVYQKKGYTKIYYYYIEASHLW